MLADSALLPPACVPCRRLHLLPLLPPPPVSPAAAADMLLVVVLLLLTCRWWWWCCAGDGAPMNPAIAHKLLLVRRGAVQLGLWRYAV